MAKQYGIKHFYDIQDRSDFKANPDYKGEKKKLKEKFCFFSVRVPSCFFSNEKLQLTFSPDRFSLSLLF